MKNGVLFEFLRFFLAKRICIIRLVYIMYHVSIPILVRSIY
jgi:hypothetical protein